MDEVAQLRAAIREIVLDIASGRRETVALSDDRIRKLLALCLKVIARDMLAGDTRLVAVSTTEEAEVVGVLAEQLAVVRLSDTATTEQPVLACGGPPAVVRTRAVIESERAALRMERDDLLGRSERRTGDEDRIIAIRNELKRLGVEYRRTAV
jgi:hypothetical protein